MSGENYGEFLRRNSGNHDKSDQKLDFILKVY